MRQKTLTTLSLVSLLLSLGLWGVSCAWAAGMTAMAHSHGEDPIDYSFFPLWIPSSLLVVFLMLRFLPLDRSCKHKPLGLCFQCGCDLRGSEGRCPECGIAFISDGHKN